ncbi:unnamed protein product [Penicillium salamii]|nr:unnamed protein product [Penicillium salamii]CAG8255933.1 unnamed protein product [Penicillium salamii]
MRMKPTPGCLDFGPEFDRLKDIRGIALNAKLVAFVEKAQSSLHKPNVDSRDQWGRTPLSWAAEYGSLAVAKILLKQGANVNSLDYEDCSPLTYLIHVGSPESGSLAATGAYLRESGAKEAKLRGIKLAWVWVLTYSRLLRYVRPRT